MNALVVKIASNKNNLVHIRRCHSVLQCCKKRCVFQNLASNPIFWFQWIQTCYDLAHLLIYLFIFNREVFDFGCIIEVFTSTVGKCFGAGSNNPGQDNLVQFKSRIETRNKGDVCRCQMELNISDISDLIFMRNQI